MQRKKISIIGAGNVGATTAFVAAYKGLGDIVLVDIVEGVAQGKALDISQSLPVAKVDCKVTGSTSYEPIKDSDIVVITAGMPRKPGMSRDDLLATNTRIMKDVASKVKEYAPDAINIVVSNPLDAMVYVAHKVIGSPKNKIMGMAGILDTTRFLHFILEKCAEKYAETSDDKYNVSVDDVDAMVLGGHGDQMIPLPSYTKVKGKPLTAYMDNDEIEKIVERTRKGGAEIVALLKTGSAYYAPAYSIVEMIDAILGDKKKILPCAAYLNGEYGAKGVFIGVPVKLGKDGIDEVVKVELNEGEREAFDKNVKHVRELMTKAESYL